MEEINKLFKGNSIEIMSKMKDNIFDMIFADPPLDLVDYYYENEAGSGEQTLKSIYKNIEEGVNNEEYKNFTELWVSNAVRLLKKDGSIYVACTKNNIAELISAFKKYRLNFVNIITWYKTNSRNYGTAKGFEDKCEYLLLFSKGPDRIFNHDLLKKLSPKRNKTHTELLENMWHIPIGAYEDKNQLQSHKPEELIKRCIIASTNYGSVILDPFCRTGTTCVVAIKTDRNYIGIIPNRQFEKSIKIKLSKVRKQSYKKGQVDLFVQTITK
ncbi:MAG: DNA-methyltransferase [Spirochaetota bacterium]